MAAAKAATATLEAALAEAKAEAAEKSSAAEARVQFMQAAIETHKRTLENERADHARALEELKRDLGERGTPHRKPRLVR